MAHHLFTSSVGECLLAAVSITAFLDMLRAGKLASFEAFGRLRSARTTRSDITPDQLYSVSGLDSFLTTDLVSLKYAVATNTWHRVFAYPSTKVSSRHTSVGTGKGADQRR